jgi:hypothetical protein
MSLAEKQAFPSTNFEESPYESRVSCPDGSQGGQTLREHYAGRAMQSLCAKDGYTSFHDLAFDAVACADALIAELERRK